MPLGNINPTFNVVAVDPRPDPSQKHVFAFLANHVHKPGFDPLRPNTTEVSGRREIKVFVSQAGFLFDLGEPLLGVTQLATFAKGPRGIFDIFNIVPIGEHLSIRFEFGLAVLANSFNRYGSEVWDRFGGDLVKLFIR